MKKILIAILAIIIALPIYAYAQRRQMQDRSMYYSYGSRMLADYFVEPAESPDSINILVSFRIIYDAMSFTRDERAGGYAAAPELEIVLRDEDDIIRKREMWRSNIFVEDYDLTTSKTDYGFGSVSLAMPAGRYSMEIRLLDVVNRDESTFEFDFGKNYDFAESAMMSAPLFGRIDRGIFEPFVMDNDIAFGISDAVGILSISYKNSGNYKYKIKKIEGRTAPDNWPGEFELTGDAEILPGKMLRITSGANTSAIYAIRDGDYPSGDMNYGLLRMNFESEDFVPGEYRLMAWRDGQGDTLHYNFSVRWLSMPLSLRQPEYAAEMMYYIMHEDEHDDLADGNQSEIFEHILQYWRDKDPTPETAYHESMATYFHRVDHAFFNYQTLSQQDGARTERGKIYILHGEPDDVSQLFEKNTTMEIWTYKNLGKQFVFEQAEQGEYKLREIRPIQSASK
ncbi:MAG: GWxTD domain-containing protein [Candidatus Kapaibacterium sp.]